MRCTQRIVATACDGKHYFINIAGRPNAVSKQRVVKKLPIDPPWAHRLCTGLCTVLRTPQKSGPSLQICDTAFDQAMWAMQQAPGEVCSIFERKPVAKAGTAWVHAF